MPLYEVNCPHCMEKTIHEAPDKVKAAEKHASTGRHGHLTLINRAIRGAVARPNPGADSSEFKHGKEHNG